MSEARFQNTDSQVVIGNFPWYEMVWRSLRGDFKFVTLHIGVLFVSLVAPRIFTTYFEWNIGLVGSFLFTGALALAVNAEGLTRLQLQRRQVPGEAARARVGTALHEGHELRERDADRQLAHGAGLGVVVEARGARAAARLAGRKAARAGTLGRAAPTGAASRGFGAWRELRHTALNAKRPGRWAPGVASHILRLRRRVRPTGAAASLRQMARACQAGSVNMPRHCAQKPA